MKRIVAIILALALLLCGCGGAAASSGAVASTAATEAPISIQETDDGYVVPSAWTEASVNDGTWGYVTAAADFSGDYTPEGDHLVSSVRDADAGITTITQLALTGEELHRLDVTLPETTGEDQSCYLSRYAFGEDGAWVLQSRHTTIDQNTGETTTETWLEHWSYDGTCLVNVSVEDTFGIDPDEDFITDLALDPEGNPMILTLSRLIFCDENGQKVATLDLDMASYDFVQDSAGRLYIQDGFADALYTLDWSNHALGQEVLTLGQGERVDTGGGNYDLLLVSDTLLRGVSLENGTITELLSWADWDLAGSVTQVSCLDENTYLVGVTSLLSDQDQLLTLTRVPADQIPEKTVVTLAAPLSQDQIDWGSTWTDSLDSLLVDAISQFNQTSTDYRVEVVTYPSNEELNLKLLTGDAPDLIDWNYTAWLDDTPSKALYAKHGYLADLEPYLDQDPELSMDDFIPSIMDLAKSRTGGLYAMPLNFYFVTMIADKEYVGDRTSWTVSEMLDIAKTLPDDLELWSYTSSQGALESFLESSIDRYVSEIDGTCDFENQEFYDLLTLCRDYFPAEITESYDEPDTILHGYGSAGSVSEFMSEGLSDPDRTAIGYPGTDGSVTVVFYEEMSICALGSQTEGAWQFLRTLIGYDFQSSRFGFQPVRQDAFQELLDWYVTDVDALTQEQAQTVRDLVYNATNLRHFDSAAIPIVLEEADAFFSGDKSAEETARIIQNRVEIYLGEQG
jgi:ABC-type glycerol-3-phosphate transport system substrate-binding protein